MKEKIGFIGGGRMAEALIKGIIQSGLTGGEQLYVVDPDKKRRKFLHDTYGVNVFDKSDPVLAAQIIILAVKPQIMALVLDEIGENVTGDHLLISIAAGIPLSFIEAALPGRGCGSFGLCRILRLWFWPALPR